MSQKLKIDGQISKSMLKALSGEFDVESIHTLKLCNLGIKDLGCVELCSGLERLDLSNNNIHRLNPVSGLINLAHLNLSANRISSLDGLQHLNNLTHLNVAGNLIGSIDGLRPLISLEKFKDLRLNDGLNDLTNPFCQNSAYHQQTLAIFPHLKVLDGQHLQDEGSELFSVCAEMDEMIKAIRFLSISPKSSKTFQFSQNTKIETNNIQSTSSTDVTHGEIKSLLDDCHKLLGHFDDKLMKAENYLKGNNSENLWNVNGK